MRQQEDTNETQMTNDGSNISSKDRYLFYTKRREKHMKTKMIFYL